MEAPGTAELAGAVSSAGGPGSIAGGHLNAAEPETEIDTVQAHASFAVDLLGQHHFAVVPAGHGGLVVDAVIFRTGTPPLHLPMSTCCAVPPSA